MAKKTFNEMLKDLEGCKDVQPIIKAQKNTLLRYEEINEMLRQFLDLSNTTQTMLLENYTSHTKTLFELKKDLEISFRRIRDLKVKLKEVYPDAFEATSAAIKELEEINRHFQENNENEKLSKSENVNEIKSVQRNDDVDCLDEIQKQLEIQAIDTANPVHDDHDDDSQLKLDNATDQLQISSDDKQLQNDSSSQQ